MAQQTHELKCLPCYFWAIDCGDKPFDVRRDDRGFQKGDIVVFKEHDPNKDYARHGWRDGYSGNEIEREISYILTGGQWGIEPGYVVLGLKDVSEITQAGRE